MVLLTARPCGDFRTSYASDTKNFPTRGSLNEDVREFYLGLGEGEARRSFKTLKTYKRRKRWL